MGDLPATLAAKSKLLAELGVAEAGSGAPSAGPVGDGGGRGINFSCCNVDDALIGAEDKSRWNRLWVSQSEWVVGKWNMRLRMGRQRRWE
jgi:hypothetical protein